MSAIYFIHKKNIAHRDIKPENLLLDANFNIQLCDFGWATIMNEEQERKSICGTYEYMPPEVVTEQPHNLKADMWSMGILLYELLHGRAPFRADSLDEIKNKIYKQQICLNKNLSTPVKDIIKRLLVKDFKRRGSAEEVLGMMAQNFEIRKFEETIDEEDKFYLYKTLYYNKYKITDETEIRSKMAMEIMTLEEKEENRKMPLKYHETLQINQPLVDIIVHKGSAMQYTL